MIIYAADLESDDLLEKSTKIHCFGFKPIGDPNNKIFVFCRQEELDPYKKGEFISKGITFFDLDRAIDLLNSPKTKGFSWHNFLGFDGEMIKKFYGIDYDWRSFNGRELLIEDTYVNSMYLHPDRSLPKGCPLSIKYIGKDGIERSKKVGPHGLESWGWRTGLKKLFVEDWRTQPLHVYVERVISDVEIQEATHFLQQKEKENVAIPNGDKKGDWELPLRMAHKTYYLMQEQERTGVCFDIQGAKDIIIRIDKEMKEIEDEVEPTLGDRILPQGQQPNFPSNPFKRAFDYNKPFTQTGLKKPVKDYLNSIDIPENMQLDYICSMMERDEDNNVINYIEEELPKHSSLLTTHAVNYCLKFGIEDTEEQFNEIMRVLGGDEEKKLTEPMRLANQDDIKNYLITKFGWKPTLWGTKNLLVDKKTKQKLQKDKAADNIKKYISDLQKSNYSDLILLKIGYKQLPDFNSKAFYDKIQRFGRQIPSTPQLRDIRGNLCPNLEKLKTGIAKKIVKWLSLRNRRTTIKSFDKDTGWLNHKRLEIDQRLPGASSGITNTTRQKHHIICNIPAASDDVLLGKEVRNLFISPNKYCCVGADCSGIEGRMMGEAAWNFDGGAYADIILNGDVHQNNSEAFSKAIGKEVSRKNSKSPFYAGIYGCQGQKMASLLEVEETLGNNIIEALWEAAPGLKKCKDALEDYWKNTGNKYIMGINGMKIFTRSKHSLLNAFLQSADACIMDWACCWIYDQIKKEELDAQRWIYYHDEVNFYNNINNLSVEYFNIDNKPDENRGGRIWSKPKIFRDGKILHFGLPKDEDFLPTDQWIQWYSRVGEICVLGMRNAGKFFNFRVPLDGQYIIGHSWGTTH